MKVRAKEDCFIAGARRKKGAEFDFDGEEATGPIEPVDGKAAAPASKPADDNGPTRNEIIAQLEAAGVKYGANDNKTVLKGLLDEAIKAAAPASSGAPDKSLGESNE